MMKKIRQILQGFVWAYFSFVFCQGNQGIWLNEAYPTILQMYYHHSQFGDPNSQEAVNRLHVWYHNPLERSANNNWGNGIRRGYHYLPYTRGINFPVKLTYLEYLCVVTRIYRSFGQSIVERLNLPCTSENIPTATDVFPSQGWLPTILVYEVPQGMDAYQANLRAGNFVWLYLPTSSEIAQIVIENSGGSAYAITGHRIDNIPIYKFNLPQRAQYVFNPDRGYLIVLTFTPRNVLYTANPTDWNATGVRSWRLPFSCTNSSANEPINYEYYTLNSQSGPVTCYFNLAADDVHPYQSFGTQACRCGNRDRSGNYVASWREYRVYGFRGVPVGPCGADVDCSGCVDDSDLLRVLFSFGSNDTNNDPNRDGVVDDGDLLMVLFSFGQGC
ncbi:MAG: hypothetical protein NZO16_05410 [Deltaproteobacteria bacterium]|nr:hypothetical protein [Deltaproteobacteria bacterium]